MNRLSSLARNTTALATSSGVPIKPIGVRLDPVDHLGRQAVMRAGADRARCHRIHIHPERR